MQDLIFTNQVAERLGELLAPLRSTGVFFLADDNTAEIVKQLGGDPIVIPAGDVNKGLESLAKVWSALSASGTRASTLVNVGGGMVTDLGGFAAATFKRGIRFFNVPTTLLGAVDAAVGGKTGVNFGGLKNEIGAFREAEAVIISTQFFATLPDRELRSGFAEMLKHGLLDSPEAYHQLLAFPLAEAKRDLDALLPLLETSVEVKRRIVAADPLEKGLRKALNLGHTSGHALESLAMEHGCPMPHGYAVAYGLLIELLLSHLQLGFPTAEIYPLAALLRENYADVALPECKDYDRLIELMAHDKKNRRPDEINFTLLTAPGQIELDQIVSPEQIRTALDLARDLTCG